MITTSSAPAVCAQIVQHLVDQVGQWKVDQWFPQAAQLQYDEASQTLSLAVPSDFFARRIGRQFFEDVRVAAQQKLGPELELKIQVRPELFETTPTAGSAHPAVKAPENTQNTAGSSFVAASSVAPRLQRRPKPSLRHHLDDFIVGPSNELAFAAANAMVQDPHGSASPLFIYGGCGLGKTHLLQGITRQMREQAPEAQALYLTGETFTNEFLAAMRANKLDQFRRKMRRLDLLCIDDVHFIAGKQATQQEFLHSFDALDLGGGRIVMASDSHPKEIEQFKEVLISRCVRGMVAEVREPELETRTTIITALAKRRKILLNPAATQLVAARCIGSVREIEGTLTKLHAMATLTRHRSSNSSTHTGHTQEGMTENFRPSQGPTSGGGVIGPALVQQLFASHERTRSSRPVHVETITDVVCEQLAVERNQIHGPGRHRNVVLARAIIAHLARQLTSMSFPEIGRALKRSSHSSVIASTKRLKAQLNKGHTIMHPVSGQPTPLAEVTERCRLAVCRI